MAQQHCTTKSLLYSFVLIIKLAKLLYPSHFFSHFSISILSIFDCICDITGSLHLINYVWSDISLIYFQMSCISIQFQKHLENLNFTFIMVDIHLKKTFYKNNSAITKMCYKECKVKILQTSFVI